MHAIMCVLMCHCVVSVLLCTWGVILSISTLVSGQNVHMQGVCALAWWLYVVFLCLLISLTGWESGLCVSVHGHGHACVRMVCASALVYHRVRLCACGHDSS